MSFHFFDEPRRAVIPASETMSEKHVLVIGFSDKEPVAPLSGGVGHWMVLTPEGEPKMVWFTDIIFEWRYDAGRDVWYDSDLVDVEEEPADG